MGGSGRRGPAREMPGTGFPGSARSELRGSAPVDASVPSGPAARGWSAPEQRPALQAARRRALRAQEAAEGPEASSRVLLRRRTPDRMYERLLQSGDDPAN